MLESQNFTNKAFQPKEEQVKSKRTIIISRKRKATVKTMGCNPHVLVKKKSQKR